MPPQFFLIPIKAAARLLVWFEIAKDNLQMHFLNVALEFQERL
jgi:hypothetical protein